MTDYHTRSQHGTFVLVGDGVTLTLDLIAPARGSMTRTLYFGGTARIEAALTAAPVVFESDISGIVGDLLRLSDWIYEHITALVKHHSARSRILAPMTYPRRTWAPLELGIQIECLGGDVWQEGSALAGDFTMRVMVLAGRGEGNGPIYVGTEVVVSASVAAELATSLRNFVADVTR